MDEQQRTIKRDPGSFEAEVRLRYAAIQGLVANTGSTTLLHIGAENTGIAIGYGAKMQAQLVLAIGSSTTARAHFTHRPPTPLEFENAIASVEDELMRARQFVPEGSTLCTTDQTLREIAMLAGADPEPVVRLPLESLERVFNRLTAIAEGRPASQDTLPADNEFAATLLIVREFMHHLRFPSLVIADVKVQ